MRPWRSRREKTDAARPAVAPYLPRPCRATPAKSTKSLQRTGRVSSRQDAKAPSGTAHPFAAWRLPAIARRATAGLGERKTNFPVYRLVVAPPRCVLRVEKRIARESRGSARIPQSIGAHSCNSWEKIRFSVSSVASCSTKSGQALLSLLPAGHSPNSTDGRRPEPYVASQDRGRKRKIKSKIEDKILCFLRGLL